MAMAHQAFLDSLSSCRLPAWDTLPDFGLYMDQMLSCVERSLPSLREMIGLTPAMINNYVKAGLIDRPSGKKYGRAALAQLLMIVILKQSLSQENMKHLLHPESETATEEIYASFLAAQDQVVDHYRSVPEVSPLTCALESATLSLAYRMMLLEESELQALNS